VSKIAGKFAELRAKGEKALVLYVTAGDPDLDQLPGILSALVEGGADLIEIGIPFSDPIADGPTIQAATQRALDRGVNPGLAFQAVATGEVGLPLVAMGYYNSILRPGIANAARLLQHSGFSGSIISDLTPEEAGSWKAVCESQGLDTIFLAAPTSTDARLDKVCEMATGFVYAVSRTGVTGAGSDIPPEAQDLIGRLKKRTELPVCVGFGISEPAHVRTLCEVADGVVIGSWLVDLLAREWQGGAGRALVIERIRALKDETRSQ
jgi:tryptophan synthase alpha chain